MKRKLLVVGVVLAAAALTGCNTPRTVGIGPSGVTGYKDGMTVLTPDYVVTSPAPTENISIRYGNKNLRGRYDNGNGGGWSKQYGSTNPDWWLR